MSTQKTIMRNFEVKRKPFIIESLVRYNTDLAKILYAWLSSGQSIETFIDEFFTVKFNENTNTQLTTGIYYFGKVFDSEKKEFVSAFTAAYMGDNVDGRTDAHEFIIQFVENEDLVNPKEIYTDEYKERISEAVMSYLKERVEDEKVILRSVYNFYLRNLTFPNWFLPVVPPTESENIDDKAIYINNKSNTIN